MSLIGQVPPRVIRSRSARASRLLLHLSIAAILIVWLLPTIGMLVNSLRPAADVSRTGWWTALSPTGRFTVENYLHVINQNGLDRAFLNSLIISVPATIMPIAIGSFAAYAFAWMRFPGRDVLFVAVIGLLVVPVQITLIPVLIMFRDAGLAGEYLTVWLAHTGYGLPFAIYLLRGYMGGLPREVLESAAIDGASATTTFVRLVVPMSVPAIASLAIFQFLFVWNDLLVAQPEVFLEVIRAFLTDDLLPQRQERGFAPAARTVVAETHATPGTLLPPTGTSRRRAVQSPPSSRRASDGIRCLGRAAMAACQFGVA